MTKKEFYTVPELSKELDLTERAIRYYESKGLISPKRAGNTRIISRRDRARLIIIKRGKRLGSSLADLKKIIDLYDVDPNHHAQAKMILGGVRDRIKQLEEQQKVLNFDLKILKGIEGACIKTLSEKKE
ncbi:MerR family DNA-binding transcriptional regulator [Caldithrix abyssi]|nr:MerR family DNA-binding transcriptional regulator [Caldithrix abyssi]